MNTGRLKAHFDQRKKTFAVVPSRTAEKGVECGIEGSLPKRFGIEKGKCCMYVDDGEGCIQNEKENFERNGEDDYGKVGDKRNECAGK